VNSQNDIQNYGKKFKCADTEFIKMQGDYNSAKTRSISISFTMCDPTLRKTCKSEGEIKAWLKQKFILTYANQRRFVIEKFTEKEKIVEESRTNWIPINTQLREEVVFKLFITDLYLQDDRFSLFALGGQAP